MRNYDFTPLYRSFVGFDRMADLIDTASRAATAQDAYPPYNVVQTGENDYRIELAVAGFAEDDFDIEARENVLTIAARKEPATLDDDSASVTYLHRGIAERGFERRFQLADHVVVETAALKHGLLTVSLKRELPEYLKPRKIFLSNADTGRVSSNVNKGNSDQKVIDAKPHGKAKAA